MAVAQLGKRGPWPEDGQEWAIERGMALSSPVIYGLMIVRDEGDVVGDCLRHALAYCRKIIVMDNASVDSTWDVVQDMARQHPGRIVPLLRTSAKFHDGLRAPAYNAFHTEIGRDDWWMRLDADEFLVDHPLAAVRKANAEGADFIRAWQMNFMLTRPELAEIESGVEDLSAPIYKRRRYYRIDWREFRLFRNDPERPWDADSSPQFPQGLDKRKVGSLALFNRHFGNRHPDQMTHRFAIRHGEAAFSHVVTLDWRDLLRDPDRYSLFMPGQRPVLRKWLNFYPRRIAVELELRWKAWRKRRKAA